MNIRVKLVFSHKLASTTRRFISQATYKILYTTFTYTFVHKYEYVENTANINEAKIKQCKRLSADLGLYLLVP